MFRFFIGYIFFNTVGITIFNLRDETCRNNKGGNYGTFCSFQRSHIQRSKIYNVFKFLQLY